MIGAVILAAGESRRMGTQKLLLNIDEKPMIEHVVCSFKSVDKLIVVLGHEPEKLTPILKKLGVRHAINKNYSEGMVSTFKVGLESLKDCKAVFLGLGDQPFVDGNYLRKAIEAWNNGAKVVSPVHNGKKGHPVLFDQSLFAEILGLGEGEFVRDVIHRHADSHELIEAGRWAITDVDTPESFRAIKEMKFTSSCATLSL